MSGMSWTSTGVGDVQEHPHLPYQKTTASFPDIQCETTTGLAVEVVGMAGKTEEKRQKWYRFLACLPNKLEPRQNG
jgi:hypothetical protein